MDPEDDPQNLNTYGSNHVRQSYSEWANNSYLLPDPQEHDARGRRATLTDAAGMFNEYNAMR